MNYRLPGVSLLFGSLMLLSGCADQGTDPQRSTKLRISLTDAPAAFEAVNITFSEFSAHIDSEWITVRGEPVTVNLLEWNNGKSIVIGTAEVPAGHYTQIRLKIQSAEVVVDGQTHALEVPSGAQSGLKLVHQFTIDPGSTYELLIDFDAERSIVSTGPPGNPRRFLLKPTIRVVPKAITGSISGVVANPQDLPTAYAIVDNDTVTSAGVDTSSGAFVLAFLPPATYRVAISDTLEHDFIQDGVTVVAGANQDLGAIALQ